MITSAVVRRALMAALFWYACSSAASRGGTGGEGGLVEVREALWMFDAAESWFVWKDAGDERNTHLPQKEHLTWKGPSDLSARVWLDVDGPALVMRVEVTDDVHVQPETGGGIWQGDSIQWGITRPGWKGYYEVGLARLTGGASSTHVWMQPEGRPRLEAGAIALVTGVRDGGVEYEARVPLAALGLDRAALQEGVKFNLIVNDNDGAQREGWIELAPGLGSGKDPEQFPLVVFGF